MKWLATVVSMGVLLCTGPVRAQFLVPPDEVVIHVHEDVENTDFVEGLVCELSRVLAVPVSATTSKMAFAGVDFATNTQLDADRLRFSFAREVEGGGRVFRYLIQPYDMKVHGLRYVFASTGRDGPLVGVMSTIRLIPAEPGLTRKRISDITALRLYKLMLKSVAYLSGLDSDGCIMKFPKSLPELDAKSDEFCPEDRDRLVAARVLKAHPVGACNLVAMAMP